MSLDILIADELKGFYKSKVMLVLWIGMPIISLLMHYLNPDTEGIPLSVLVSIMVASLSGTLAAVMLSTTVVAEKEHHVYDLFLIRPVKPYHLMLAKLVAVYVCIVIATIISLITGLIIDMIKLDLPVDILLEGIWDSLAISMAAMAIACSIAILLGILVNSTMVAAILAIYLGNQLSMVAVLPALLLENIDPVVFSLIIGLSATILVNVAIYIVLRKKQF